MVSKIRPFFFQRRSPSLGKRLAGALVAPPLAMALFGLIVAIWSSWFSGAGSVDMVVGMVLAFTLYGSMIAYAGILLVALPANMLLNGLNAERGIAYVLLGAAGGLIPILALQRGLAMPDLPLALFLALPGALTAALWWLIASRASDRID